MSESLEIVTRAERAKEEGNALLKAGDYAGARTAYTSGISALDSLPKPTEEANEPRKPQESDELRKALSLNLALACLKLQEWFPCIEAAGNALKLEPNNVKALLRRGVARANYGMLDQAKDDFNTVLKLEPSNAEAKKELISLKKQASTHEKEVRKQFSGLFARNNGGGLYNDREKEMSEQREREEAEKAVRKVTWEKEQAERQLKGEATISFDDWEKERVEKEEAERKKLAENPPPLDGMDSRAYAERRKQEEQEKHTKAQSSNGQVTKKREVKKQQVDGVDLDEEDLEIIKDTKSMGYCYFRRDLTEVEKEEREKQLKPMLLPTDQQGGQNMEIEDDAYKAAITESAARAANEAAENKKGISSWNSGGTSFEEKDVTTMAKDALKDAFLNKSNVPSVDDEVLGECFMFCSSSLKPSVDPSKAYGMGVKVTKVGNFSGEASMAVVRGSKRFLFEFATKVDFEVSDASGNSRKATLEWAELSSTKSSDCKDWTHGCKLKLGSGSAVGDESMKAASAVLRWKLDQAIENLVQELTCN